MSDDTTEPDPDPDDDWTDSENARGEAYGNRLTGAASRGYSAGYNAGAGVVDGVRSVITALVMAVIGLLISVTRLIPRGEAFWGAMLESGYRGLHKSSGGDIVGIIARDNGQLDHRPMKWKRSSPDDPTEPDRWVTKQGERWHPGAEGRGFEMVGSTPVALFDEDAESKGSFLQSRFQTALDLGRKEALFIPERVEQVIIEVDGQAAAEGGPEAIADGGAIQREVTYNIPDSEWPDKLADVLVDLSSPDGEHGMRVSAKAYKEVYQEKVGSEEMQMQELRGRAAEQDPKAQRQWMMKLIRYGILLAVAVQAPEILGLLLGTGVGDAAQDLNPFWLAPMLGL